MTTTVVKEEVKVEEEEQESSESSEEMEQTKEEDLGEGTCDHPFCQEKTFMRCDYDMNDIIDPRSSRC